jgi:negative regulator of flagellin synthesis FlgM
MNTTISSNGLPQLPLANTSTDNSTNQAPTSNAANTSTASAPNDSVQLTDSARALQQASSVNSPVNTAKVEQIKQSLAAGTYQVNPNAIANSLTSLESQINGTS